MSGPYEAPQLNLEDYASVFRHKSDEALRTASFVLWTVTHPRCMRLARGAARLGLALRIPGTERALRNTVFRQFCGGTSLEEAVERSSAIFKYGITTILDYAIESAGREEDFASVAREYERVIQVTDREDSVDMVALKLSALVRSELLEKVSSKVQLTADEEREYQRARTRLVELSQVAARAQVALFVDAEHSWIQGAIDELVESLMETFNGESVVILSTLQLYLENRLPVLEAWIERARQGGYRLGVKLVRGAYLEQEHERAAELGYPCPVQKDKASTDADYDAATTLCLENLDVVSVCVATHNVESTLHMTQEMARLGIEQNDPRVSSSQLLGMFDRITVPLANEGYRVLKYVPYGGVRDALPYLMRRADENRSVAAQLRGELEAVRAELRRRGLRSF